MEKNALFPGRTRLAPGIAFENLQLSCCRYCFVTVLFDVKFGRFTRVVLRVLLMPMRGVRVVGR